MSAESGASSSAISTRVRTGSTVAGSPSLNGTWFRPAVVARLVSARSPRLTVTVSWAASPSPPPLPSPAWAPASRPVELKAICAVCTCSVAWPVKRSTGAAVNASARLTPVPDAVMKKSRPVRPDRAVPVSVASTSGTSSTSPASRRRPSSTPTATLARLPLLAAPSMLPPPVTFTSSSDCWVMVNVAVGGVAPAEYPCGHVAAGHRVTETVSSDSEVSASARAAKSNRASDSPKGTSTRAGRAKSAVAAVPSTASSGMLTGPTWPSASFTTTPRWVPSATDACEASDTMPSASNQRTAIGAAAPSSSARVNSAASPAVSLESSPSV